MRTALVLLTATATSTAFAQSSPSAGAAGGANATTHDRNRARAIELTRQAASGARNGNCYIVAQLEPQVRSIDPEYHRLVFAADPMLAACRPVMPAGDWPPPSDDRPASAADRNGLFLRGTGELLVTKHAVGLPQVDVQLGWTFASRLGLFVSGSLGVLFGGDEPEGYNIKAAGIRLWLDPVFLDARLGRLRAFPSCEFDDPCTRPTYKVVSLGIGYEIHPTRHLGADLYAQAFVFEDVVGFVAGVGMSIYPFSWR